MGILGITAKGGKIATSGVAGDVSKALRAKKIQAWHASPHNFDKFDISKMGTGEGNQAFGEGIYTAETKSVAQQYFDQFATEGGRWKGTENMSPLAQTTANEYGRDIKGAIKQLKKDKKDAPVNPVLGDMSVRYEQAIKELQQLDSSGVFSDSPVLYKVEIDIDPDKEMLDWDLPLGQQSEFVQDAIKKLRAESPTEVVPVVEELELVANNDRAIYDKLDQFEKLAEVYINNPADKLTRGKINSMFREYSPNYLDELEGKHVNSGEDILSRLKVTDSAGAKKSADLLNSVGIKGIRYDDGFSRGKEGGTKNFVVFDDSLITIAEKNGIPMQQVDNLAKTRGIPKQQALAMLVGGGTGMALMGGSERADAGGLGSGIRLLGRLKDSAKKSGLDSSKIKINDSGAIEYPKEFINPLSESGAGDVRREVAIHNDAVESSDFKSEFGGDDFGHGTNRDINEFDETKAGFSTSSRSAQDGTWLSDDLEYTAGSYANYSAKQAPVRRKIQDAYKASENDDWDLHDKLMKEAEDMEADIAKNPQQGQNVLQLKSRGELKKYDAEGNQFFDVEDDLNDFIQSAKREGYDGVEIENLDDAVGLVDKESTHRYIFNPKNIRSKNAAFDPQFKDSPNLLGQVDPKLLAATAAVSTGAATAPLIDGQKDFGVQDILEQLKANDPKEAARRNELQISREMDLLQRRANRGGRDAQLAQSQLDKMSEKNMLEKFLDSASPAIENSLAVIEPAMMIGGELGKESLSGLGAIGTGFMHNLADSLERQDLDVLAQYARPDESPQDTLNRLRKDIPSYEIKSKGGQRGMESFGKFINETTDYWMSGESGEKITSVVEGFEEGQDQINTTLAPIVGKKPAAAAATAPRVLLELF